MAIASSISAAELARIVQSQFVNQTFEVALVNAGGTAYSPETTVDSEFLALEVTTGTGGYARQIISFEQGDITPFSDDGIGLATKVAVFEHDGSSSTINFSHVVLIRGDGNIESITAALTAPSNTVEETMIDGTYLGLPTTSNAAGESATIDLIVANSGANGITDYTVALANRGREYENGDTIEITPATLVAVGACNIDLGSITMTVQDTRNEGGAIVSASATSTPVILGNGNEAVFYFNNKVFGFADGDS